MAFSRFQSGMFLRLTGLMLTLLLLVWVATHTSWFVSMALLAAAVFAQAAMLMHFAARSSREVARFLDAIAFDDASTSFQTLSGDSSFAELGTAMTRVLDRLRTGRAE